MPETVNVEFGPDALQAIGALHHDLLLGLGLCLLCLTILVVVSIGRRD